MDRIDESLRATEFRVFTRAVRSKFSVLRFLMYESLEQVLASEVLGAKVLDVGGGQTSSYLHLFPQESTIDSVNISPTYEPTILQNLEYGLDIDDTSYDSVISLNTLEHIFRDRELVHHMIRVLKPSGMLLIAVPFLFRIHGSPSDFSRHTSEWWRQTIIEAGISEDKIRVIPLISGPTSLIHSIWGIPFQSTKRLSLVADLLLLSLVRILGLRKKVENLSAGTPIGYMIIGRKPSTSGTSVQVFRPSV